MLMECSELAPEPGEGECPGALLECPWPAPEPGDGECPGALLERPWPAPGLVVREGGEPPWTPLGVARGGAEGPPPNRGIDAVGSTAWKPAAREPASIADPRTRAPNAAREVGHQILRKRRRREPAER